MFLCRLIQIQNTFRTKLKSQITVRRNSLKNPLRWLPAKVLNENASSLKNRAIFRRDAMIADCALWQYRQQLRKTIIFETTSLLTFPFSERTGIFENAFHSHIASQWWKVDAPASLCFDADSDFHTRKGSGPSPGEHRIKIQDRKRCGEKKLPRLSFSASFQCFGGRGRGWSRKILSQPPKRRLFLFSVSFSRTPVKARSEIIQMLEITSLDFIPVMNTSQLKLSPMKFNHDFEFHRRLDYDRYQNFRIASVDECSSCSKP